MFSIFLKHEMSLYVKRGGESLNLLAMFLMCSTFFVMSQPFDTPLDEVTSGVLWVCALLVLAIAQYRLYERDYLDGTLQQWAFLPMPLEMVVLSKCLAHWIMMAVPLMLVAPVISIMMTELQPLYTSLLLSLGLGTLSFMFLGSLAAATSLRFRSRDVLTTLLVLPMAVPVLVFGAMAAQTPVSFEGAWAVLFAYTMVAAPVSCILSAMLLRVAQE